MVSMINLRELKEAVDKKRRPLERLVEQWNRLQERKAELQRQQVYYRDREKFWEDQATEFERKATVAREKSQKAAQRRERAERVLRDTDWEKDTQERLARIQQIEKMESYLAQIEKLLSDGDPITRSDRILYEATLEQLERNFRSAKGTGL